MPSPDRMIIRTIDIDAYKVCTTNAYTRQIIIMMVIDRSRCIAMHMYMCMQICIEQFKLPRPRAVVPLPPLIIHIPIAIDG